MFKRFLFTAACLGGLSVILGAFGAHALKEVLTEQALTTYETAVRYQFYYVFALALAGVLYKTYPNHYIKTAGNLFIAGVICFSGSLYLLAYMNAAAITGFKLIGALTPVGGALLIAGWCFLAAGIRKG